MAEYVEKQVPNTHDLKTIKPKVIYIMAKAI